MKDIDLRNNVIKMELHYTPKDATLKKKFGNLPLKYVRMRVADEEQLALFETAVRRYNFDLEEDDDDSAPPTKNLKQQKYPMLLLLPSRKAMKGKKKI